MATTGRALAEHYGARADLVVTGAVLHDIGKLHELHYDTTTTYTRDGNLVGHITLGAMMVADACRGIQGFPDELRTEVLHLIVSHHGVRERGSPIEPASIPTDVPVAGAAFWIWSDASPWVGQVPPAERTVAACDAEAGVEHGPVGQTPAAA